MSKDVRVRLPPGLLIIKTKSYGRLGIYIKDGKLTVRYTIEQNRGYGIEVREVTEEVELEMRDLTAIKTLIIDRERQICKSHPMNAREVQGKDKVLRRLSKLQWWNWIIKPKEK